MEDLRGQLETQRQLNLTYQIIAGGALAQGSSNAMMATPHLGEAGPHPVVASAARELLNKSENERSGVLSTAMSFLGLYRDPVVAKVTSRPRSSRPTCGTTPWSHRPCWSVKAAATRPSSSRSTNGASSSTSCFRFASLHAATPPT